MQILPYSEKYREDVQKVCINTGPPEAEYDNKMNTYILSTYCNYYIDNEPDNVFVLVDDNDRAQGYVLCAQDFKKYKNNVKKYQKKILNTGYKNVIECIGEFIGTMAFSHKFSAHIHIDINSEYTHCGYGKMLMETELENLKNKGVKGVMLIVNTDNENAIKFYKRNNFKVILGTKIANIMGITLNED